MVANTDQQGESEFMGLEYYMKLSKGEEETMTATNSFEALKLKIRKKPVEVEAILWDGTSLEEIKEFCGHMEGEVIYYEDTKQLDIPTLNGPVLVDKGEYILRGIHNETWPVKPEIFEKTYEIL